MASRDYDDNARRQQGRWDDTQGQGEQRGQAWGESRGGWGQGLTGWLALSGAAILLERIGGGSSPLAIHEEPAAPRDRTKDTP